MVGARERLLAPAGVAQLVAHPTCNRAVRSSSLLVGSTGLPPGRPAAGLVERQCGGDPKAAAALAVLVEP